MTPDTVIQLGREALGMTVLLAGPLLLAALLTGLLIGLFQAATQINEQTLSFIPKLLAMLIALFVSGPWLVDSLLDYTRRLVTEVLPQIIGT